MAAWPKINRKIEIQVVEDSVIQAKLIKCALTRKGYIVTVASNGAEALTLIRQRKPTLVISDIAMPVMDGYQMCHEIKHDDTLKDIPVMLLTQLLEPEDIIRGLNAGANSYVIKPYDEEYLLAKIEDLLSNLEILKNKGTQHSLEIFFAGKTYTINADRREISDFLVSAYDQVVRQNRELTRLTEKLQISEERYRTLLENTFSGFYRAMPDGKFLQVNPAYVKILGYDNKEELFSVSTLSALYTSRADYEKFLEKLASKGALKNHVAHLQKRAGGEVIIEENIRLAKDYDGHILYFEGFVNDITEQRRREEIIRHRAFHDALTNLPNRLLFMDRLIHALAHAHRYKQMMAVMFLDLDGFKQVNDMFGHSIGDQLLRGIAERLTSCVRESDTVSRMGGDEFTILLPEITGLGNIDTIAGRITDAISQPWNFNGHECHVTASIGIALYPKDGKNAETLVNKADIAMYYAKKHGKNNYQLYTPSMNAKVND